MGKNSKPRKPYFKKSDSLGKGLSPRERMLGKLNIALVVLMALAAAAFVFYSA